MGQVSIEVDSHIILKQYTCGDAEVIFQLMDKNRRYLKKFYVSAVDRYENVSILREDIARFENGNAFCFGVWDEKDLVGSISFTRYEDLGGVPRCVIGYWVDENCQGVGYIGRSIKQVIQYIFDVLGAYMIHAIVSKQNTRSINVLKKAGFDKCDNVTEFEFTLKKDL